jgi:hypothetical protein
MKQNRLLIPVLTLIMLVACTSDGGHDRPSVKYGGHLTYSTVPTGPFRSARSWIRSLNEQGVPCRFQRKRHPDNAFFKYQDSGSCVFTGGHTLTVWIVKDAHKTFRRRIAYFLKTPSPTSYFYRQNWLVIATKSIPAQAIQTIRELFHARVRQNLG